MFQVGRNRTGGAASIGFSTSKDGGRTWREGTLPGLTANTTPRGPSARASDPVVAYDAAHGVWLANTLAIAADATRLTIHRSTDGLSWSGPIDAALTRSANLAYDKNWLTCDNGAASPFRGRCYLAYTLVGEREDDLAVQRSDDGGRTWSPPVTRRIAVTGVIPVVQPDGKLVLAFWSGRTGMVAVSSTDGGVTLGEPGDDLRPAGTEREASARAAADRRRRRRERPRAWPSGRTAASTPAAPRTTSSLSRSADGTTWSTPARVTSGRNAVIPTLGVEPGTGRIAIAYYVIQPNGIDAELVTSDRRRPLERAAAPQPAPDAARVDAARRRSAGCSPTTSASAGRAAARSSSTRSPRRRGTAELRQAIYAARG